MKHYDYIIAGAGAAGLSLLVHMIETGKFDSKKILLVDRETKNRNDRTWCFWENKPGIFESIVYARWDKLWFHGEGYSKLLELDPYQYKLIRGIDFYEYCLERISKHSNIEVLTGQIDSITPSTTKAEIIIDGQTISSDWLFNSIVFDKPVLRKNEHYLLQHFKGWIIDTVDPVFDPAQATLMDFRTDQSAGTTFVYTMPFSTNQALIEYTLFSGKLLNPDDYDKGLKDYISQYITDKRYSISSEEFGIIPMTNHRFTQRDGRVINIGTAGGQTKASSGYTFQFIQKHSKAIVQRMIAGQDPGVIKNAARYRFYDSTLLHILANNSLPGSSIFTTLFKKNKPQPVLRFLDNDSSIADELKIISSLPTCPFLKAAIKQL